MATSAKPKPLPEDPEIQTKINDLLSKWTKTVADISVLADIENQLRAELIELCFPDGTRVEGSGNKMNVGHGCMLQCTQNWSRKTDEAALDALTTEENREKIDAIYSYVPKLSVPDYKALSEEDKKLFHEVITVAPNKPALKLVRPKRK